MTLATSRDWWRKASRWIEGETPMFVCKVVVSKLASFEFGRTSRAQPQSGAILSLALTAPFWHPDNQTAYTAAATKYGVGQTIVASVNSNEKGRLDERRNGSRRGLETVCNTGRTAEIQPVLRSEKRLSAIPRPQAQ